MPGSWELKAARDKRVLVAVLLPPDMAVSADFAINMRKMELPPGSDFSRVVDKPFGPARNLAAKTALESGFNLMFLDADIRAPHNSVTQLQATGLDLVGGLYFQRRYPYAPVVFNQGRDDKGNHIKVPVTGWKPGDIVPCTFLPSGLTYHSRRLLEAVFERYKSPFTYGQDVAPVMEPEGVQALPFSEDFSFSFKSKQIGYQPYCHTGIVGLHETRAVVGPRWILSLPDPNPLNGLCEAV